MDDRHLKRDPRAPGAVLNTNRAELEAYKIQKAVRSAQEQRLNRLEQQVADMDDKLGQILSLLTNKGA